MENILNLTLSLILASLLAACAHGKKIDHPGNIAEQKGMISMWAGWVKDKKKTYDVDLHIKNQSDQFIIVMEHDMTCMRGGIPGKLKYTFFNTGERTIDLGPGQEKSANMVCSFGTPTYGDFEVKIDRVYSNPSHDRTTPGEKIAGDLVWKASDKPVAQ